MIVFSHFLRVALGLAAAVGMAVSADAATYTVTSTADTGDVGTLRWAITQANADAGSFIQVPTGLGTITLTSDLPQVSSTVTLTGSFPRIDTNGNDVTFASNMNALGPLYKSGEGILSFTTATVPGFSLNVTGGTLRMANTVSGTIGSMGTAKFTNSTFEVAGPGMIAMTSRFNLFILGTDGTAGTLRITGGGGLSIRYGATSDTYFGRANQSVSIESGTLILNVTSPYSDAPYRRMDIDVPNNGTLVINAEYDNPPIPFLGGWDFTINGVLSGTGSLVKNGSGTLYLTAENTYTGRTVINRGDLVITSDANLGAPSAPLTLDNNLFVFKIGGTGDLTMSRDITIGPTGTKVSVDRNTTWTGALGGSGDLIRAGSYDLTLTNGGTYSGNLVLESGTTILKNAGAMGTANISMGSSATLALDLGDGDSTFANAISGEGTLRKTGAGTVVLSGTNTFTGDTQVNGGVLSISSTNALGMGGLGLASGTLRTTGNMITARNVTLGAGGGGFDTIGGFVTFNGNFSGTGGLTKSGGSILTLNGSHSYTGATSILAGTLKIGDNGATASAFASSSIAITSGARMIFANSQSYAGDITGAGLLQHEFSGTTTLTGTASHTGGTDIIGGTIQVGNGGTTGAITGNVALSGGGTLAFDRNDDYAFGGMISGTGGVNQLGSGRLTLLADSSYNGTTVISAGQFLVEGSLTGSGLVNLTGGAIGGDGIIGGSLHFGLGSAIVFDATKTLTINGATVTFDGFSMANLLGLDSTVALGTYTLLDGPTSFDFTNVANFGPGNGYALGNGKYAYFQSGSLDVVVVPEPSTWALIGFGVGVLGWYRRRSLVSWQE